MSQKQEILLPGKIVLRTRMEICAVWAVTPSCWNHSKSCWRGCQLTLQKCLGHDFVPLCIHSDCTTLRIHKAIRTNNAMSRNCTPHCRARWWISRWLFVAQWRQFCLFTYTDTWKRALSDRSNVSSMSLLFFTESKNSLQNCSRPALSLSLRSWATWIVCGW